MSQAQSSGATIFRTTFRELMKGVCTCIPGNVRTFDAELQRAQVQIGIQSVSVSGATIEPPPIVDVPVLFLGGTQYSVAHQIDPGDEGLILFSQRCIDAWKQTGGVASNPLARFHSAHDALFIPGFRPLATRISGFANDGIRLQSRDGSVHVWIKSSGEIIADNGAAHVQITAAGEVNIENGAGHIKMGADGTVNINGVTFAPDGKMTSTTTMTVDDVIFSGISAKGHKHPGDSGGTTGGPEN